MSWQDRRYSPWLLDREESLTHRRDNVSRLLIMSAVLVALLEGLWPWQTYTPDIPSWIHIAAASLVLPVMYLMLQNDARIKVQQFNRAMDDVARRLYFLDYTYNPEEFELQERMQGALLRPTQRAIEQLAKANETKSLRSRVNYYYSAMPTHILEADRMGPLSIGHPKTAVSWISAILLAWALFPVGGMPLMGWQIGTSTGLSLLPLLLLLYLFAARANTRFAYEQVLYSWLRLG